MALKPLDRQCFKIVETLFTGIFSVKYIQHVDFNYLLKKEPFSQKKIKDMKVTFDYAITTL